MTYVTRISVWFSSEGASPADVISKLIDLGFTPVRGAYDFVYEHNEEINEKELGSAIMEIADAIHAALSGFNVLYTMDTHPAEEDPDYVPIDDIDAELEATRKELQELEKEV